MKSSQFCIASLTVFHSLLTPVELLRRRSSTEDKFSVIYVFSFSPSFHLLICFNSSEISLLWDLSDAPGYNSLLPRILTVARRGRWGRYGAQCNANSGSTVPLCACCLHRIRSTSGIPRFSKEEGRSAGFRWLSWRSIFFLLRSDHFRYCTSVLSLCAFNSSPCLPYEKRT